MLPEKNCSIESPEWEWAPATFSHLTSNSKSQIFINGPFLIPGDSTQSEEKFWAPEIKNKKLKFLILGHHGSKTSTSTLLLKNLPQLKLTISTSRWKRYHHPHSETLARLNKFKIPLLRTEDWGNIHFIF